MDRHLRRRVEEALRGFASSGRSGFAGHEDADLSGYLDIANSLRADADSLAGPVSGDRGRAQMLSSLSSQDEVSGGVRRMIFSQPLVIKVAGAAAGVAMVFVGMAGASAAAGGPNVADSVFNAAGIGDTDDDADVNDDVNDDTSDDVNDDADQADDEADDQADVEDANEVDDEADDQADVEDANEVDDEADDQADVEDASEVDDEAVDTTDHAADDSPDGATDGVEDTGEVDSD